MNKKPKNMQITLAGGCFWCTEAVFQRVNGVTKVTSGYTGGNLVNPTYEDICTGMTGHAEAVQVDFDKNIIELSDILSIFLASHDPTSLNRQGNDIGTQYRSAIFYSDINQKSEVELFLKVAGTGFSKPLVTTVEELKEFYKAEDYHQNFYRNNQSFPYCQIIIEPKLKKLFKT